MIQPPPAPASLGAAPAPETQSAPPGVLRSHLRLLLDAETWLDNPFLRRDARRDAKRGQPWKSLAIMLCIVLVATVAGFWGLLTLEHTMHRIPWFFGAAYGNSLMLMVCGVHSWFVLGAANKRSGRMFDEETLANTLPGLLAVPTAGVKLAAQAMAYPWCAAMRVALAGLPVYAFCLALGGPKPLDVLMVYAVFGAIALVPPLARRPLLGLTPPTPKPGQPATNLAAQAPASLGAAGAASYDGVRFAVAMPILILMMRPMVVSQIMHGHYIPTRLLVLLPMGALGLPFALGRALVTPLDWFGWSLCPLLFAAPLFLAGRYVIIVRTSLYMRVGAYRELANLPDYLYLQRVAAWQRWLSAVAVVGFVWRWAVVDGGIAGLALAGGTPTQAGLAGFLMLTLGYGALAGLVRGVLAGAWWRAAEHAGSGSAYRTGALTTLRFVSLPFLQSTAFVAACVLPARLLVWESAVAQLAIQMVAIGLSGAVLAFAGNRLIPHGYSRGALVALAALLGPAPLRGLVVFSPFMGVVTRADVAPFLHSLPVALPPNIVHLVNAPPPWWQWPAASLGTAAVCAAFTAWGVARRKRAGKAASVDADVPRFDPAVYPREVFADAGATPAEKPRRETPLADLALRLVGRLADNGIAIKEARPLLRRSLWQTPEQLLMLMAACTVVVFSVPFIWAVIGGGLRDLLMGPAPNHTAAVLSGGLCAVMAGGVVLALLSGFSVMPLAFAPEWRASTLPFILITPLRTRQIVLGKLGGLLLGGSVPLMLLGAWSLVVSLPLLGAFGPQRLLAPLVGVFLTGASLLLLTSTLGLAVAAWFPRQSATLGGVVLAVGIQVPIQAVAFGLRTKAVRSFLGSPDLSALALFALLLFLGSLLVSLILVLIAGAGVRRMRRGDVTFGAVQRGN